MHLILFFPTKIISMERIINNALNQIPGAVALVDIKITNEFLYAVYYFKSSIKIEGKVLIDPKLADWTVFDPNKLNIEKDMDSPYIVIYSNDGKIFYYKKYSKEEYESFLY